MTCRELERAGLATLSHEEKALYLTPDGMRRAQTIVRNHRLWERYLTDAANYAPDHVHDDAEEIEHILEYVRFPLRRHARGQGHSLPHL